MPGVLSEGILSGNVQKVCFGQIFREEGESVRGNLLRGKCPGELSRTDVQIPRKTTSLYV